MGLPIDENVVKRVEEIAKIEKQSTFDQYSMFEWAPVITVIYYMIENEDNESNEENSENELIKEIFE